MLHPPLLDSFPCSLIRQHKGLLPMIERLWVAYRRRETQRWKQTVQGGGTLGVTEKAWGTWVADEIVEAQGDHTTTAFLDSPKCSERAPHVTAARRVVELGAPGKLAQLMFDVYRAPRRVRLCGASSAPATGSENVARTHSVFRGMLMM